MTATTTSIDPPKRRRRRTAAILAVLFLLIGAGLLLYTYVFTFKPTTSNANPTTSPTAIPSTQLVTVRPSLTVGASPSPGGVPVTPPPATTITRVIAVPTFVEVPGSSSGDSDAGLLSLVTTVTGLLASIAGVVSAVVSVRTSRRG